MPSASSYKRFLSSTSAGDYKRRILEEQKLRADVLKIKRRTFLRKIRQFNKIGITLLLLMAMVLTISLLVNYLGKKTDYKKSQVKKSMELIPPLRNLKSIIASNSETCDELGRSLYIDEVDNEVIMPLLALCLSLYEPHRGSLDSKMRTIVYTNGQVSDMASPVDTVRKFDWFDMIRQYNYHMASSGPASAYHSSGGVRFKSVMQHLGSASDDVILLAQMLLENYLSMKAPVSKSLATAIDQNENLILNMVDLSASLELTLLQDGGVHKVAYLKDILWDYTRTMKFQTFSQDVNSLRERESANIKFPCDEGSWELIGAHKSGLPLVKTCGGQTSMIPSPSHFVMSTLMGRCTVRSQGDIENEYIYPGQRFKSILSIITDYSRKLVFRDDIQIRYSHPKPNTANMFIYSDMVRGFTAVHVSTIGSPFGSRFPIARNSAVMHNNLMRFHHSFRTRPFNNVLYPLMAVSKKTNFPFIVMVSPGGLVLTRALGRFFDLIETVASTEDVDARDFSHKPMFYGLPVDDGFQLIKRGFDLDTEKKMEPLKATHEEALETERISDELIMVKLRYEDDMLTTSAEKFID
ncbi:unnamed protein product [Caenorhabditis auriculariae]|uniref:Uncharacterized protein n=1 Tax=Caenorhabditis auriculariae TaxID=2777116 RepID=A0A8S1GPS7_9PELO|nr:unnamed protein product [Caenorhabditis auriculariae]